MCCCLLCNSSSTPPAPVSEGKKLPKGYKVSTYDDVVLDSPNMKHEYLKTADQSDWFGKPDDKEDKVKVAARISKQLMHLLNVSRGYEHGSVLEECQKTIEMVTREAKLEMLEEIEKEFSLYKELSNHIFRFWIEQKKKELSN